MGFRFEMPVGTTASSDVAAFTAQIPTDAPNPDTIALFVGDNANFSHQVAIAVIQAEIAFKKRTIPALPLVHLMDYKDPTIALPANDLSLATEDSIWVAWNGDVAIFLRSEMRVGAMEKLFNSYKNLVGVGPFVPAPDYGLPAGVIGTAVGDDVIPSTIDFSGSLIWRKGTTVDILGTTDADSYGLGFTLKKDYGIYEFLRLLSGFLTGWNLSTTGFTVDPIDPTLGTLELYAANGGVAVEFTSIVVTP